MKRRLRRASAQRFHESPTPPRSRYAPWRAAMLGLVYLLMAAHVAHWLITGKTLAPLELNEVMYTFELGIVTAGFLFMASVLLTTAIFGRFFCSWGCHILALQDLSTWILKKVGVRPKAIRSRFLAWVPVLAAVYMFAWPQVMRIWEGRSVPRLHIASDATGWASFTTENFWRNLPGPGIIAATFVVCGFVAVYLLGSRGFCRYACPYGVLLGLADRVATGRIRIGDDCLGCGTCTSVCGSHVRVHEELARFGTVVNPACLKDLDCISACPQQSLHYGFGLPSLVQPAKGKTRVRKSYDFALWEEAVMMLVFAALLPILRGLYDALPFLLSVALAGIGAYGSIVLVRLTNQRRVTLNRWPLKAGGRLLRVGKAFVAVMVTLILLAAHSGVVHYHSYEGRRYFALSKGSRADRERAAARAIHSLEFAGLWGLVRTERNTSILADLYIEREDWSQARRHLQWLLAREGANPALHLRMGSALAGEGDRDAAHRHYQFAVALNPNRAESHYALAGAYFDRGEPSPAMHHLREAVRLRPNFHQALYDLGALLIESEQLNEGIGLLRRVIELNEGFADAHYNLSVALAMAGRMGEAITEIETAKRLNPTDDRTNAFRELLNQQRGP